MPSVSKTFSGADQSSDEFYATTVAFELVHAGTATVALQWDLLGDDDWTTVDSAYTASVTSVAPVPPIAVKWRFTCTAHTNNVVLKAVYA